MVRIEFSYPHIARDRAERRGEGRRREECEKNARLKELEGELLRFGRCGGAVYGKVDSSTVAPRQIDYEWEFKR